MRLGRLSLLLLALLSCDKKKTQPPAPPTPAPQPQAQPSIDGARMHQVVADLAADGLGGRYTLHEDIGRAADYLAKAFTEAGIAPVGDDYRAKFSIVTGAELTAPPKLTIVSRGREHELAEGTFTPVSVSGSGEVEGEVVFVGYAAKAAAEGDHPAYDDLEGIDLKDKIAVVLLDAPARPSMRGFFRFMRGQRVAFHATAEPLRDKGDTQALAKLHKKFRNHIAKTIKPYLRGQPVPEAITAVPDPTADLDTRAMTNALMELGRTLPGPQFGLGQDRLSTKLDRVQQRGAAAVIVLRGPRSNLSPAARAEDALPAIDKGSSARSYDIPVVHMKWKEADKRLRVGRSRISKLQAKIDEKFEPQSQLVPGVTVRISAAVRTKTVDAPNVLALIPGTERTNEIVVLGAHYDHIGIDEEGHGNCDAIEANGSRDAICNGADDNASGTAMVVEVARALAGAGYKPRRSLVFALFAGEEIGLHGSKALVTKPPAAAPFDGGKVVAMINLDMVGRLGPQGLAIGGVGSSSGWLPLLREIDADGVSLLLDRSVTSRSDHAAFYRQNIPVLFFFTQLHDDYHRPGDEIAKINREGMGKIAEFVTELIVQLGDGAELPFSPAEGAAGLVRGLPGSNPENVIPAG